MTPPADENASGPLRGRPERRPLRRPSDVQVPGGLPVRPDSIPPVAPEPEPDDSESWDDHAKTVSGTRLSDIQPSYQDRPADQDRPASGSDAAVDLPQPPKVSQPVAPKGAASDVDIPLPKVAPAGASANPDPIPEVEVEVEVEVEEVEVEVEEVEVEHGGDERPADPPHEDSDDEEEHQDEEEYEDDEEYEDEEYEDEEDEDEEDDEDAGEDTRIIGLEKEAQHNATRVIAKPEQWVDLPDPLTDLRELPENARFADYVLRRELGHGSMSRVMLGHHVANGAEAAIKMLDPRAVAKHPELVGRFEREARAIRKLTHIGIAEIYAIDRYHGVHYIAMERIRGRNLQHLLGDEEQRLFAPKLAARIVRKVADALCYGYDHGVVHRDVKLDNIMVDADKDVKVLDFGLALDTSAAPSEPRLTAEMSVLGSPNYISPEQARGQAVDFRTDMYSLGICFYYMTTGRFPFIARDTIALIRKHVFDEPRKPTSINPQIPVEVEAVILRMMEKDRDNRFASWQALIDVLDEITGEKKKSPRGSQAPQDDDPPGDVDLIDPGDGRRYTSSQIIALSDGEAEEILAMDALDTGPSFSGEMDIPAELEVVQSDEARLPQIDELPPSAPPIAGARPARSEDPSIRAPRAVAGTRPPRARPGSDRPPARRSERSVPDDDSRDDDRSPARSSDRVPPPPPARRTTRQGPTASGRGIGGSPPPRSGGASGSGSGTNLPARKSGRIERDDDDTSSGDARGPRPVNPRRRRRRTRR